MKYQECPIMRTLEVIGGKWKPIILHYLAAEPRRSGELGRLIPQASGKMLIQQLRELQADGVIERVDFQEIPPKVEYSLTPLGRTLAEALRPLCDWGTAHSAAVEAIRLRRVAAADAEDQHASA